ncbi:hypothetical protein [Proteiniborus sp.]|uniref:hypothetical protein n=1 Tax=Proteiniborus sp. TaxID=2079015 RepID=UPI00331C572E
MRDNIPSTGRGNKILPAILITANVLMLVIGILTIPPNLKATVGSDVPEPRAEQTAPIGTVEPDEDTSAPALENLSTEERPDLADILWYTEDVVYDGVPSDANAI